LRAILAPLLALAALIVGLVPGVLETGRLDPLDWLLWSGLAMIGALWLRRGAVGRWDAVRAWALIALPIAMLCGLAGVRVPSAGIALLWLVLTGIAVIAAWTPRKATSVKWMTAAGAVVALLAVRVAADRLTMPDAAPAQGLTVGVVSALPLYGMAGRPGRGLDHDLQSMGARSPLWRALEQGFDLRPLDAVDDRALQGLDRLLLAHPRQLAPAELVAIDGWARGGGQIVILADPLLRWPDERALSDPRRAPLTSLLDPLLAHWGLRLAPAQAGQAGPERRALSNGVLLQMAASSHFTLETPSACVLSEQGLIARCKIGRGIALLMADADWINDALWTIAPDKPRDLHFWTGDAIPTLTQFLVDPAGYGPNESAPRVESWQSWVKDQKSLVFALRWALLVWLLLGALVVLGRRFPISSHPPKSNERDQKENMAL
jgi:hypothetical protein